MQSSRDPFRQLWRALSVRQQRFVTNALVALLALAALGLLDQSHWLLRLENSAMDTMMELNRGLGRMAGSAGAQPLQFTFLDIDEDSYRAWQEPHHTPRDKLLQLVDFAARSGARLIVVDIDLSKSGINPEHDRALANYLSDYSEQEPAPIVLVRSFYGASPNQNQWNEIRPTFLDDHELSESVHWGHPLFQTTLWDGVVRHWNLARFGCLEGHLELVPSIQLTVAALLSNSAGASSIADIEAIGLVSCEPRKEGKPAAAGPGPNFESGIGQRLIFTIAWNEPASDLITIPAAAITESGDNLADDLLDGRIAIIGASFADSGDIHRTPIGEMPGALVIVNAIKSLTSFGQLREPPAWISLVQQIGIILLAAWAFSRFDSIIAVGIAAAVIIALLVPISFYVFKYGLWVSFSIPLLAMLIHRGVAEYRCARERLRDSSERVEKTG